MYICYYPKALQRTNTANSQPQHHYAKGSSQREGLLAAVQSMKKKGTLEVPIVVGGKEVCYDLRQLHLCGCYSGHLHAPLVDQDILHWHTSQPLKPLRDSRHILQSRPRRRQESNRVCPGSKASMGVSPLRRPSRHLPQGRGLDIDKVQIRHHGSHDAWPGQERMAG